MKRFVTLGAMALAGVALATVAAMESNKLSIGGKTVDAVFITQNGHTFVRLSDVATAMNCVIQKSDAGYALAPIGKGNMVQGNEGKVGQTIGVPEMQFTVTSVEEMDHYNRKFSAGEIDAFDANSKLVVVMCKVRNGLEKTINICTLGGAKTAITDMDEHSYEVLTGDGPRNVDILPGAVSDFGIIFKVPKAEKLKALVYETDGFPKVQIFRVTVADAASG